MSTENMKNILLVISGSSLNKTIIFKKIAKIV